MRAEAPPVLNGITEDSIHAQVDKLLANHRFASSGRYGRLLRYLLEETLAGRGGHLEEYALGVEVLGRQGSFDPQTDPIVRTEISRLRAKLKDYYEGDGRGDALVIDLPKRSYALTFQLRGALGANGTPKSVQSWLGGKRIAVPGKGAPIKSPQSPRSWLGWKRMAVAASLIIGVAGFWLLARDNGRVAQERVSRDPTSVAVLPFVNLSGDAETEHFSDGLTEEIIHSLSAIDGLRVVSRTSAFQFKGKHADLRTIAAQTNAGVVLEGAVRRSGNRMRVTARLVSASDGRQLRSDTYEHGAEDILTFQEVIARQLTNGLRVHRLGGRNAISTKQFTNNVEAYSLYLKGRYHAIRRSELDLREAIAWYERAIAADPNYAPAHAGLADAYVLLALLNEEPPGKAMLRAKEAAQSAVRASDVFARAHSALGSVLSLYDWDWAGAEKEFRRALDLDPHDPGVREAYAMRQLVPRGRLNSALFEMLRAQSLDPFSPKIVLGLGKVHHFNRDPDQAIKTFQQVLHFDPSFEAAPLALAKAYVQKSLAGKALGTLQEASAPTEDEARLAVLGHAYALSGQPKRARQVLKDLQELSRQQYVSGYYFALLHLALGEKTEAVNWLEKAAAERCPLTVYLNVNPLFDSLRGERRFAALLDKMGLGA